MNQALGAQIETAGVGQTPKVLVVKHVVNVEAKNYLEENIAQGRINPHEELSAQILDEIMQLGLFAGAKRLLDEYKLKVVGGTLTNAGELDVILDLESTADEGNDDGAFEMIEKFM